MSDPELTLILRDATTLVEPGIAPMTPRAELSLTCSDRKSRKPSSRNGRVARALGAPETALRGVKRELGECDVRDRHGVSPTPGGISK